MLAKAYQFGISGAAWFDIKIMGLTVLLGGLGTILLFFGLRLVIGFSPVQEGRAGRNYIASTSDKFKKW